MESEDFCFGHLKSKPLVKLSDRAAKEPVSCESLELRIAVWTLDI
jgi:hypothetical protein